MSFKSWFRALEDARGSWLGFGIWSLFGYGHWSFVDPYYEFWLSILIWKVQRTSMSLNSWSGALEDARGSWLGFGILTLIWIWSLVFDTPVFLIVALYLDYEGTKDIHVLKVLIWGFGGFWGFLTEVRDFDLNNVTSLSDTNSRKLALYIDFEDAKNIHVL